MKTKTLTVFFLMVVMVACLILFSGCETEQPYWRPMPYVLLLLGGIVLTIAFLTRLKMTANFACAAICVGAITFFLCGMDGCNNTDTVVESDPVAFREVVPPNGSKINPNSTVIARFDGVPTDLSVMSGGTFSVKGLEVTVNGPFTPGTLQIDLTWTGGATVLTYTVKLPAPGEVITFPSNEGRRPMVLIPAGDFQMGSNDDPDQKSWLDEGPVHTVHVDAFYMDTYEVTNLEWHKFISENPEWQKDNIADELHDGFYLQEWKEGTYPIWKEAHPVTHVSWYAAMAYAQWAGGGKRLPTEAEWEKAARGGLEGQAFPWGDSIDKSQANYDFKLGETEPVGRYSPNGYGLYDVAGNVWEWVLDEAISDFYDRSPLRNPLAGVPGDTLANLPSDFLNLKSVKVMRGGSLYSSAASTSVTVRGGKRATSCLSSVGFRCVQKN